MKESMSYIRQNIKNKAKMIYFSNLFQITSILFLYVLIYFPANMIASGISDYIVEVFPVLGKNLYFSFALTYFISSVFTIIGTPLLYGIIFNINKVEQLEITTYSNYFIWLSKPKYIFKSFLVRINYIVRSIPFVLIAFSPVIIGFIYLLISNNPEPHIKNLLTGNYLIELFNELADISQSGNIEAIYDINPVLIRNVGYQFTVLLFSVFLKVLLLLRFFLVDYIIVKNPDMKISAVFRNSKLAMRGHYGEFIIFMLSFIPVIFITSILCNFFSVFIYVYIFVATVLFANKLIQNYFRKDEPIVKTVDEVQL